VSSDRRVRLAANLAIDRKGLSQAETLGASPPTANVVPRTFEFALPLDPYPYDPVKSKQLLAEAGYPNGFDAGDLYPWPPYFSAGEAITNDLNAVGIKTRVRTMERAAFYSALATKKLRGLCMCVNAVYGNAASRLSEIVPSDGAYAYGGYPDIDALYKEQARGGPGKARGVAAPDSAAAARAREIRTHLRLHLAQRGGPAGGRSCADADRPLPLVGATRRGAS